eukprot:1146872-Pelagomonas_calceolata.AAC.2
MTSKEFRCNRCFGQQQFIPRERAGPSFTDSVVFPSVLPHLCRAVVLSLHVEVLQQSIVQLLLQLISIMLCGTWTCKRGVCHSSVVGGRRSAQLMQHACRAPGVNTSTAPHLLPCKTTGWPLAAAIAPYPCWWGLPIRYQLPASGQSTWVAKEGCKSMSTSPPNGKATKEPATKQRARECVLTSSPCEQQASSLLEQRLCRGRQQDCLHPSLLFGVISA